MDEIKKCIIEYDYPLAKSMSNEELADIFNPSNRCFLMSWLFNLCENDVTEEEKNINNLGQKLYKHGFCTLNQHLPFMTGALDISEQFIIFHRIFNYIQILKKPLKHQSLKPISLDDIDNVLNKNMNLFPMFGGIKTATDESKVNEPVQKNKKIGNIVGDISYDVPEVVKDDLLDLHGIKSVATSHQNEDNPKESTIITENEELITKCCENLNLACQLLKNINAIEESAQYTENIDFLQSEISPLKAISDLMCNYRK